MFLLSDVTDCIIWKSNIQHSVIYNNELGVCMLSLSHSLSLSLCVCVCVCVYVCVCVDDDDDD